MTMHVIGTGVGRTGTYSLKLALNSLGLGPCHHMEEVLHDQTVHVPLWTAAVRGAADRDALIRSSQSANLPTREIDANLPADRS
ncbi:MAG TPA: sulfotransferase [Thermohalobaculum sp.]|nr:sulfotransferase [Thermohalobaculum sp.]